MKQHDPSGFAKLFWHHIVGRVENFFSGFTLRRAWRFWGTLIDFIIVYFFSEDGKLSLNNKIFTGFGFIAWNSIMLIV